MSVGVAPGAGASGSSAGAVHTAVAAPPPGTAVAQPNVLGNLTYHNGAVMQKADNTVALFWLPPKLQSGKAAAVDPNYVSLIKRYFADIGGSRLYQVATQYSQVVANKKQFIVNSSKTLLAEVFTGAYPKAGPGCNGVSKDCLDDAQVAAYAASRIKAHPTLPEDQTTEYYVFLAPHESSCFSPTSCFKSDTASISNFTFCAYHTSAFDTRTGKQFIYANMPYGSIAANGIGCTTRSAFPNNRAADVVISTISHEQMEAATDPLGGGWYFQSFSGEIGDECAYNYGPVSLDGGKANELMNGHYYLLQQEWSNADHGCVQGKPVA